MSQSAPIKVFKDGHMTCAELLVRHTSQKVDMCGLDMSVPHMSTFRDVWRTHVWHTHL